MIVAHGSLSAYTCSMIHFADRRHNTSLLCRCKLYLLIRIIVRMNFSVLNCYGPVPTVRLDRLFGIDRAHKCKALASSEGIALLVMVRKKISEIIVKLR